MPEREQPTEAEVASYLRDRHNWGRWGEDDQRGAINLITPKKRAAAAALVRSGRIVSLSRDIPTLLGPENPLPAHHWMRLIEIGDGGAAIDYFSMVFHGYTTTHVDALCHVWDREGMWNGRDPAKEITTDGTNWGGVEHWRDGIVTRGVLLDVPKHRREPFVTLEKPVHGWELDEIVETQGVDLEPGDAVVVYGGREAWQAANPSWSAYDPPGPGLHASCLEFLRDHDVAVLVWDLMDSSPTEYDIPWTVHGAIFAYGVALVDNSLLQPLAEACAEEGRYEFMLTVAPLPLVRGTGSPVNPIALF
jgi:kynurenine formamidase